MEKDDQNARSGPDDIESGGIKDTATRDVNVGRLHDGTEDLIGEHDQLQRGLKSRHIQFLALGGA